MQKIVEDFISKYDLSCGEKIRYMDLVSEIGELGKEIIKGCAYGKSDYKNTSCAVEEMGDCIFSMLALCSELNIDSKAALDGAIFKYEKRFKTTGDTGSGR